MLSISHSTTPPELGGGAETSDQCSLNFAKIEFEYKEQKPDGTLGGAVKAGYDVKSNKMI